MTVTIHSPFKAAPRISEGQFVRVLERQGSYTADPLWDLSTAPAPEAKARAIYRLIASSGHDPAVWLAILGKESTFGTNKNSVLWRNLTRSWTNARTVRHPSLPRGTYREVENEEGETEFVENGDGWYRIFDSVRNSFYIKYTSAYRSVEDGLYRVDEPGYAYRIANATSILEHILIWAPSKDSNKPRQYAETMTGWINQWIAEDTGNSNSMIRVALSAGHYNTSGGNATEKKIVGPLTYRLWQALDFHPDFDVRLTHIRDDANKTVKNYPGNLSDVARVVVNWANAGWKADLFWEVHTEGNGSGNGGRGQFGIYPDNGSDVDTDARDRLIPEVVERMALYTGIPPRNIGGGGVMSEKQTGVGSQGHRLGVFAVTASERSYMTRLIFEYGAHSAPLDHAIQRDPEFSVDAALASIDGMSVFFGVPLIDADAFLVHIGVQQPGEPPEDPHAPGPRYSETSRAIAWMFKNYWKTLNNPIATHGFPMTNGYQHRNITEDLDEQISYQVFERSSLGYYKDAPESWKVRTLLPGEERKAMLQLLRDQENIIRELRAK